MSTELPNKPKLPVTVVRTIVDNMLPRAIRVPQMKLLNTYHSLSQLVPESTRAVLIGYETQARNAFNKTAFVAELAALTFCFTSVSLALHSYVLILAVLGTLTIRDAFLHPFLGSAVDPVVSSLEENRPAWQYLLIWLGDAVAATVALLVAQTLMLKVAPLFAMSGGVFWRGAVLCLPVLATLRMTLRNRPEGKAPFEGSKKSAETIYQITLGITIVWMAACCFVIVSSARALPPLFLGFRGLVVAVPIMTFSLWLRLQQDPFARDNRIRTLRDGAKADSEQQSQFLMTGLKTDDPFYPAYSFLQVLTFMAMAAPLAMSFWPWLSGQDAGVSYFRLVFNLVSFATLSLSWNYIKRANRAAAEALRRKAQSETP